MTNYTANDLVAVNECIEMVDELYDSVLARKARQELAALTPAGAEPVVWQYRVNLDGQWTSWRATDRERDFFEREEVEYRPLYAHPAPVTVEASDHPAISIGDISNYYGGLILKREGGIDYWAIENWNGDDWKECDPRVASALRALSGEKS